MDGVTKVNNWQAEKRWTDALLPRVKEIAGRHLIAEAPWHEDARHATDLIVLELGAIRLAVRIRRNQYYTRYAGQFTIRSETAAGQPSELSKILQGWGTHCFYAFANEDATDLTAWVIGDLNIFRLWHHRQLYSSPAGIMPGMARSNGDGDSKFFAYHVRQLPPEFIVAERDFCVAPVYV